MMSLYPKMLLLILLALVQLFTVAANTNSDALSSTVKRLQKFARPIGATMVAFGLAVLALG